MLISIDSLVSISREAFIFSADMKVPGSGSSSSARQDTSSASLRVRGERVVLSIAIASRRFDFPDPFSP